MAIKDLIDLAGTITTAGSRLVAETARPAVTDARCLAGARRAGTPIVGKTNLVELAFGTSGVNPFYGTPLNPLDPALVPGGSSSGSAVAVATGQAEVAYGTDTGGSIRIPSACCGTCGLKTSFGRVSTQGVRPLAPSMDTVGPMAACVEGLVVGMGWLEAGFVIAAGPARRLGRVRLGRVDPVIEEAIDAVLAVSGFEVAEVVLPGWERAWRRGIGLLEAEAALANHALMDRLDRLDPAVAQRLARGAKVSPVELAGAREYRMAWSSELASHLEQVELLVLPTLVGFPPRLEEASSFPFTYATGPVNLAGLPALSQPIPAKSPNAALPASLQLIGPHGGEELLLSTGLVIEGTIASGCT